MYQRYLQFHLQSFLAFVSDWKDHWNQVEAWWGVVAGELASKEGITSALEVADCVAGGDVLVEVSADEAGDEDSCFRGSTGLGRIRRTEMVGGHALLRMKSTTVLPLGMGVGPGAKRSF